MPSSGDIRFMSTSGANRYISKLGVSRYIKKIHIRGYQIDAHIRDNQICSFQGPPGDLLTSGTTRFMPTKIRGHQIYAYNRDHH